jgi:hypothetical protein
MTNGAEKLKECANTDRELWRETEGDYYAPSIHVTEHGGIGINVGGTVVVRPIREWHALATRTPAPSSDIEERAQRVLKWVAGGCSSWGVPTQDIEAIARAAITATKPKP